MKVRPRLIVLFASFPKTNITIYISSCRRNASTLKFHLRSLTFISVESPNLSSSQDADYDINKYVTIIYFINNVLASHRHHHPPSFSLVLICNPIRFSVLTSFSGVLHFLLMRHACLATRFIISLLIYLNISSSISTHNSYMPIGREFVLLRHSHPQPSVKYVHAGMSATRLVLGINACLTN